MLKAMIEIIRTVTDIAFNIVTLIVHGFVCARIDWLAVEIESFSSSSFWAVFFAHIMILNFELDERKKIIQAYIMYIK